MIALFFWLQPMVVKAQSLAKPLAQSLAQSKVPTSHAPMSSVVVSGTTANAPLCRFGINASHSGTEKISDFDLASLRAGWYIDYRADATNLRPAGLDYAPMIRLVKTGPISSTSSLDPKAVFTYTTYPSGADLIAAITANPGAHWFVGNEPDRRQYQDDMPPALYATAYHEVYQKIKGIDPTARIFAGSIVQPTPLRMKYLDLILKNYLEKYGAPMPVDGWSIHNFILNEASCDFYKTPEGLPDPAICWGAEIPPDLTEVDGLRIGVDDNDNFTLFKEQIVRFRRWMADRGYGNTPLFLSEYGVLMPEEYGFSASRVNTFMSKTFDYLLNTVDPTLGYPADNYRLVQRLSWYSTTDTSFNGYLFEKVSISQPYQLSEMGKNYVSYTKSLSATVDLSTISLSTDQVPPPLNSDPVTFTLKAMIANSGNAQEAISTTVRFYDNDPSKGGKQIGADQPITLSGCGETTVVKVTWPNVASGNYKVYVVVDPENKVVEGAGGEQNNQSQATVFFASDYVFLPLVSRSLQLQ